MLSSKKRALLIFALSIYSVLVCVLDIVAPMGVEVWVLNLPVFLVPMLYRNRRMVILASLTCTVMVVLGSVFSPPGGNPRSWDIINRGMGLVTIWLIVVMALNAINRANQLNEVVFNLKLEIAQHNQTSRLLELSEERFRLAVEGVRMGTFDVQFPSGMAYWSATHLRMLGYQTMTDVEPTADLWLSRVYPDDRPRIQEIREKALRDHSLYAVEYRVQRVDNGEIVWIAVFGRWYYNKAGEGVRFLGVSIDITQRKEFGCQLLEQTATAERYIGQELHDSVGQEITGLGLMAQTLSRRLPEASAEQRLVVRLVAGLNQMHKQVRALARGLIPVEMESKGLWAALDDLAASTSEKADVAVQFECPEWVVMPDHSTSMELYRIAQEAVSNALRHGRPRRIHLSLLPQGNGLCLHIKDDGIGIRPQPKENKGLGLRIMEHRAALIGGILHIEPAEEGGAVVSVGVALEKRP